MKLCYRGVDYEIVQSVQPQSMSVTPVTLIYRGDLYQLNPQRSEDHRFVNAQWFQNNFQQTATARPQLIYRGIAYLL